MQQFTTQQYADMRGICNGAVRKAIKMGHKMEGVIDKAKFGKSHVIYVSDEFVKKYKKRLKKSV